MEDGNLGSGRNALLYIFTLQRPMRLDTATSLLKAYREYDYFDSVKVGPAFG